MSSSRSVEDTYEAQNDQRLDELHSKIRTLRAVTGDIHDDVERQNLMLDDTGNRFGAFGDALGQTARRAEAAFGARGVRTAAGIGAFVVGFVGVRALLAWFRG